MSVNLVVPSGRKELKACTACAAPDSLGGVDVPTQRDVLIGAVRGRVARPLERLGIPIDRDRLEALLT